MIMLPRLQAEEQLAGISAGRVAQGVGDERGRASIQKYTDALERQREGATEQRQELTLQERMDVARAAGFAVEVTQQERVSEDNG